MIITNVSYRSTKIDSKKRYETPKLGVIVLSNLEEALVANCKNRPQGCITIAARIT